MRNTPKMKVMPAETRNSQDANVMPSIRMIGRIFMRTAPQHPLRAEWNTARPRPQRALTVWVGTHSDAKAGIPFVGRALVRRGPLAQGRLRYFRVGQLSIHSTVFLPSGGVTSSAGKTGNWSRIG